ncbi:MAG: energy-coupling factor transporter ATPase [Eubacteriales bacterium]|nr:energy-coupling factor transporter ATPase [Eubacteriales bacterium]
MPIIINNLSHNYTQFGLQSISAIQNINVCINEGDFIGILGHTGSGKSTFVQHLNGLLLGTSGDVTVDGLKIDANKANLKTIRNNIGLVFQYPENQLFEETIYKDIAFGPTNMGLDKAEVDVRVREAMKMVGLDFDKFASLSPFEISGGQMRRVAIAGVIAMHPKYLVLDEPTAGLDPKGRNAIMEMIWNLHKNKDVTVVMVSHNMDEISKYANKLFVFNRGEIVQQGSPKEIFSNQEKLNELGLDVPQIVELAQKLKQNGIDIESGIFTMDEMIHQLKNILQVKND